MAEWQTRLVQVQVLSPEWGFNSPRRHQIYCKKLRVWHNGCAPAFQAGYRGSTPLTRSIKTLVGFPSGQRGQTVNLLAQLSMVRIHLPPPFQKQRTSNEVLFFCNGGGDHGEAVNDAKQRGVETSGSTARSDVRERSESNPSPTTISKTAHLKRGAFFLHLRHTNKVRLVRHVRHVRPSAAPDTHAKSERLPVLRG